MPLHTPIARLTKPTTVPHTSRNIIATKNQHDREGEYPSFIAISHDPARPKEFAYATHVIYYNDDAGDEGWHACWGHYDMTEAAAREDFVQRSPASSADEVLA